MRGVVVGFPTMWLFMSFSSSGGCPPAARLIVFLLPCLVLCFLAPVSPRLPTFLPPHTGPKPRTIHAAHWATCRLATTHALALAAAAAAGRRPSLNWAPPAPTGNLWGLSNQFAAQSAASRPPSKIDATHRVDSRPVEAGRVLLVGYWKCTHTTSASSRRSTLCWAPSSLLALQTPCLCFTSGLQPGRGPLPCSPPRAPCAPRTPHPQAPPNNAAQTAAGARAAGQRLGLLGPDAAALRPGPVRACVSAPRRVA